MLFWVPAGWKILAGVYYRFAAETPLIALMIPCLHCFTCGNKQKTRKSLVTTLSIYKQPASPCCGREAAAGEGEAMNELKTPPGAEHHPGTRRTFIIVSHPGTRRTFITVHTRHTAYLLPVLQLQIGCLISLGYCHNSQHMSKD